jgi:hypothetical protein
VAVASNLPPGAARPGSEKRRCKAFAQFLTVQTDSKGRELPAVEALALKSRAVTEDPTKSAFVSEAPRRRNFLKAAKQLTAS